MLESTEMYKNVDVLQANYEKNSGLSKCEDVILEARRVILNEQLDKISNITLSEVNNSRNTIEKCVKQCKESLKLQSAEFWKDLAPNPQHHPNNWKTIISENDSIILNKQPIDNLIESFIKLKEYKRNNFNFEKRSNCLTKKYFLLWRDLVKFKKEKDSVIENKLKHEEKLEKFVKKIKKCKKQEKINLKNDPNNHSRQVTLSSPQIYKNRYNAQKNIISMQKVKLEEQNKVIEELKLGIIREDLLKSIENTKNNIREIFSNCSTSIRCKAPVVILEESQQFKISTQKVPKVVQQLEERALQRAQKRQLILERKRLIEEARQRMMEELIENKRVLEEQERKKNLEIIKERRKRELEQERIRQINKQKFMDTLKKAIHFFNKRLLTRCFQKLYDNYRENKNNTLFARNYYEAKLLKRGISCWCDFVEDTYKLKYEIADAHYTYTILKYVFQEWRKVHIESIRNMQVAEDLHDFRLTSNTFIHWHRYVCSQFIIQNKKLKIAENHLKRRLLFHYFYLWRSLPAVIQLEKAKELKKRKWRERVWEIIPDYKPPEDI